MSSFTDYQAVQQYLKTKLAPITDGVVLGNLNRDRSISKYQGKVGYIAFAGYPPQTDSQGLRSAYTVHVYKRFSILVNLFEVGILRMRYNLLSLGIWKWFCPY